MADVGSLNMSGTLLLNPEQQRVGHPPFDPVGQHRLHAVNGSFVGHAPPVDDPQANRSMVAFTADNTRP